MRRLIATLILLVVSGTAVAQEAIPSDGEYHGAGWYVVDAVAGFMGDLGIVSGPYPDEASCKQGIEPDAQGDHPGTMLVCDYLTE